MKAKQLSNIGAVLFSFFVMGFCDIVGISSDYAREAFGWSQTMAGLLPSMVFVWFLFFSVPIGVKMNKWGRKNTVLLGMAVTIVGMVIPLMGTSWACLMGYAALGIGNAILQVSENPLIKNVVSDEKMLTSSLTAGQVVKAVSSFCGPFILLFAVIGISCAGGHYAALCSLAHRVAHPPRNHHSRQYIIGYHWRHLRPAERPHHPAALLWHLLCRRH